MGCGERRKCKCCRKLFRPDPRNRHHQYYCSRRLAERPARPRARRAGSPNPRNRNYFRGPVHVARVQAWRRAIRGIGAGGEMSILRYKMS
jgi:hypothetical protein